MLATSEQRDATPTLPRQAHTLATHITAQEQPESSGRPQALAKPGSVCRALWQPTSRPAPAAPHKTALARGRRVLRHARPLAIAPGCRLQPISLEVPCVPLLKTVRLAKASANPSPSPSPVTVPQQDYFMAQVCTVTFIISLRCMLMKTCGSLPSMTADTQR